MSRSKTRKPTVEQDAVVKKKKADPALRAAYFCAKGYPQKQIAQRLKVTIPTVTKYLQSAHKRGYLHYRKIGVFLPPEDEDIGDIAEEAYIEERELELLEVLSKLPQDSATQNHLKSVQIYDTPDFESIEPNAAYAQEAIYDQTAGYLATEVAPDIRSLLLENCSIVGVGWGRLLYNLWRRSDDKTAPRLWRTKKEYTFFPTLGMASVRKNYPNASTVHESPALAQQFSSIANGKKSSAPIDVQHYFPPAFIAKDDIPKGTTIKDFREWWLNRPPFREIFLGNEGKAPLIEKADAIISTVGSAELKNRFMLDHLGDSSKDEKEQHRRLFYGNIGPVLLPKRDLSEEQLKQAQEVSERLIGATKDHFFSLARRASVMPKAKRIPGVIACAATPSRALSTIEACRQGLITHLFIDKVSADVIFKQLSGKTRSPRKPIREQHKQANVNHHVPELSLLVPAVSPPSDSYENEKQKVTKKKPQRA